MSERDVKNIDQFIQRWPRWRYRRRGFTWRTDAPAALLPASGRSVKRKLLALGWENSGLRRLRLQSAAKKGAGGRKRVSVLLARGRRGRKGGLGRRVRVRGGREAGGWSRGAERGTPLQC